MIEQLFLDLYHIFKNDGWVIAAIALGSIILLGILKYCGTFKKLEEKCRHFVYLSITVGLSVIAAMIYLACVDLLTFECVCAISTTIFGLNQAAYSIYSNTPLKEIVHDLGDKIKELLGKFNKQDKDKDVRLSFDHDVEIEDLDNKIEE